MDIQVIKRLEHISLKSELDLMAFGELFQKELTLPTMKYDYENETEWLEIDQDGINYNISRPYKEGTLQEWDDTTPKGCNFGIILSIHKDHPYVLDNKWVDNIVGKFCKQLAITYNTTVNHHRSFIFGIGISERKNIMFYP
jgi:hypothetical protein